VLADARLILRAGTVEHAERIRSLRRDGMEPRALSAREEELARADESVLSERPSASPGSRRATETHGERRLIAALRYRADEVQLGRALHAVAQDPDVARALAGALLAAARSRRPWAGRRATSCAPSRRTSSPRPAASRFVAGWSGSARSI